MSMRYVLFVALLAIGLSSTVFAQSDTVYYDKDWKELPGKLTAHFYRVRQLLPDGGYQASDYFMNGTLQMSGRYSYKDSLRNGYFTYYSENGVKDHEGLIKDDRHQGEWKYYRAGDEEILWYTQNYVNDTLQGSLKSYYKNGKLKREEIYKDGELINGKRFSEEGIEMVFTPFNLKPSPMFDIPKYLSKNIDYPKECSKNKIGGRVLLKFVVNTDGVIESISIVKKVHPLIDKEAIRVVAAMPAWRPGMRDDVPAKYFFTLPIKFTP